MQAVRSFLQALFVLCEISCYYRLVSSSMGGHVYFRCVYKRGRDPKLMVGVLCRREGEADDNFNLALQTVVVGDRRRFHYMQDTRVAAMLVGSKLAKVTIGRVDAKMVSYHNPSVYKCSVGSIDSDMCLYEKKKKTTDKDTDVSTLGGDDAHTNTFEVDLAKAFQNVGRVDLDAPPVVLPTMPMGKSRKVLEAGSGSEGVASDCEADSDKCDGGSSSDDLGCPIIHDSGSSGEEKVGADLPFGVDGDHDAEEVGVDEPVIEASGGDRPREKRGTTWGPFEHAPISRGGVTVAYGITCRKHNNHKDKSVCKKYMNLGHFSLDEAERRVKHWVLLGCAIDARAKDARTQHIKVDPKKIDLLSHDELDRQRLVLFGA
jgi:hypothetical protein